DLEHACTDHPRMTRQKWTEVYKDAFARYYTDEHVEKIMRRAVASRLQTSKLVSLLAIFSGAVRIEGVHPLQFGLVRRKSRTQRRSSMPMVNPLLFYPWRAFDFSSVFWQWLTLYLRYYRVMKRIKKDPASKNYVDEALRLPAASDEADKIVELFADKIPQTHGAPVRAAVGRQAM
ncbi:MAG: radical SAM protein, partial [Xanthobacteraceae bacterium]